jgi:hypothetical protein
VNTVKETIPGKRKERRKEGKKEQEENSDFSATISDLSFVICQDFLLSVALILIL